MRIGLNDIDAQVARAIVDRLCVQPHEFLRDNIRWSGFNPIPFSWEFHAGGIKVRRKREPNEDEKEAHRIRKSREDQVAGRAVGAIFVPGAVGTAVGFGVGVSSPLAGIVCGIGIWLAGTTAGIYWARNATPRRRLAANVQLSEWRAAFPLLTLSRAERVYCDAVLLMARMDTMPEMEVSLRETLRQMNSLLDSSRRLETRRLSLLPLLGSHSVPELTAEYGSLGQRLDGATDAITRQMLERSLEMCGTRLENARALAQGIERLNTQQEAIAYTLSSALSEMGRMQIISDPHTEAAAQEIAETVAHMSRQTHAVEEAVQEVMSLHSQ